MPTGRITFPGGLTGQSIPSPNLPPRIPGIRGGTGVDDSSAVPDYNPATPVQIPEYGALQTKFYAGFVPEVAKANFINPSNQGQNALDTIKAGYYGVIGNRTPARMQFSEGYTTPLQVFAASNTWQLAGPNDVNNGTRAKQPNQKFVSPFASLPIPTRMPWDL